jgi:hypothetical protein
LIDSFSGNGKAKGPDSPTAIKPIDRAWRPRAIENVFAECVIDLGRILILDGIEILPNGFRVRCHDLHGQLPAIVMQDSGDTFRDKNQLAIEVCKILATVKPREEMARFLPGGKFLQPTRIDGRAIAGFQAKPFTWIGEGCDFPSAYHDLHKRVIG